MSSSFKVEELLRSMGDSPVPLESAERTSERRETVVGAMQELHQKLHARANRHKLWKRRLATLAVAAAPALLLGGLWKWGKKADRPVAPVPHTIQVEAAKGQVQLVHAGSTSPLRNASGVDLGDILETARGGSVSLVLRSGTQVNVGPATKLQVAPDLTVRNEKLLLDSGRVDVHVPKLPQGGSFAVHTPDTVVEVHGTRFTVIVEGEPPTTTVSVSEGLVAVPHGTGETFLRPGAKWSSSLAKAALEQPTTAPSSGEPKPASRATPSSKRRAPPKRHAVSELAQQNALLQQAMDARRRGNPKRAIQLLDSLLQRYPHSPLVQEARVERFRALRQLGENEAATKAARRYLAEHPDGFAGEEARDLALDPNQKKQKK